MKAIELDFGTEAELEAHEIEQEVKVWLEAYGLEGTTFEIVQVNGPAAGWPVVRFTSPEDEIQQLVVAYDAGNGDWPWLMSQVTDA